MLLKTLNYIVIITIVVSGFSFLPSAMSKTTSMSQTVELDVGKLSVYVYVKPSIFQTYVYDATVTVQRIEGGEPVGQVINMPFVEAFSSYELEIPAGIYNLTVSHPSLWPKPYTEPVVIEPNQVLNKNVEMNRFKSKNLYLNLNNMLMNKLFSKILLI